MATQPIALVTVGGLAVLRGQLSLPLRGAWEFTGEVDLGGDPPLSLPTEGTPVTILFAQEGADPVSYQGTVRDAAEWQQRGGIRVVGGGGRLKLPLPAQGYSAHPAPVSLLELLKDLMLLTGEIIAPETAVYAAGISYGRWSRQGAGEDVLDAFADDQGFDVDWRVKPDGTIFLGPNTWTDATPSRLYQMDDDGVDGKIVVAADAATILPGTTILGKRIARVLYLVEPRSFRAELFYQAGELAEIREGVRRQIPELPYLPPREGTVLAVNSDGTLQVRTDAASALDRVPLLVGAPGMKVIPQPGDKVRLWFSDASPSKYFATGIEQDAGALKGVVRVGDSGSGGSFSALGVAPGAPIQFVYTGPDGIPLPPAPTVSIQVVMLNGSPHVLLRSP